MAYCGPRGIPYTTFVGWDQLSQDAAIAWAAREAGRCHGCGQVKADHQDADGVALTTPLLLATPIHCPTCAQIDGYRAALNATGGELPPGTTVGLAPAEVVKGMMAEAAASRQDDGDAATVP